MRNEPKPKKSSLEKSKVKTMLICFYDSKGIVHKELDPPGQNVNAVFYLGVLKRLVRRIRRVRPEYREDESWRLLHDNAPSARWRLFWIKLIDFADKTICSVLFLKVLFTLECTLYNHHHKFCLSISMSQQYFYNKVNRNFYISSF